MFKVLLVDDDEAIRFLVSCYSFWESCGFCIAGEASNGEEALLKMKGSSYDVVLADIRMPKMDGLMMVQKLRESGNQTHVIITSTYSDFKYAKQAMRLGVVDFIEKPLTEEHLLEALLLVKKSLETKLPKSPFDFSAESFYQKRICDTPEEKREEVQREYDQIRSDSLLLETCSYFLEHFKDENVSREAAETLGISQDYLSRRFKQKTGLTLHTYLTIVRMEYAKQRLCTSHSKIYEISDELGYQTADHFTRLFRQYTGMTPNQYRKTFEKETKSPKN